MSAVEAEAGDLVEAEPEQLPVLAESELPWLERVRASWPGYLQLQAALTVVDDRVRHLPMTDGVEERGLALRTYAETLADSAAVHGALPGDIGARILQGARRAELITAERMGLRETRRVLQRRLEDVEQAHIDAGLQMLDEELQQLLAELRATVDTLADIRTADQAIRGTADQHAAFLRLDALRFAYADLRNAQIELVGDGMYQLIEHAGELSNVDEVWPEWWRAERMPGVLVASRPPWPSYVDRAPYPPTITTEHVVWLATSAALAWVPTRDQLAAEAARLAAAADRLRHAALTGRPPAEPVTDPGIDRGSQYVVDDEIARGRRRYSHIA